MALRASRMLLMAATKTQRTRASAGKISTKVPKSKTEEIPSPIKREKTGLWIPRSVSPEMGKFFGVSEISRVEATKKIWEYIKENNLQNPTNKREIICDDKLKTIFDGREIVGMMELSKLMGPHFIKTN